jgi:hypothetical protein
LPEAYIVSFENQPQYGMCVHVRRSWRLCMKGSVSHFVVYSPKHIISKFISQSSFIISEDPKYIKCMFF